jgi:hypothetical protein
MTRQTGATTKQMQSAPRGAIYLWCNDEIDYAKRLAALLGRSDLRIVKRSWLETSSGFNGDLVVDHAFNVVRPPTDREKLAIQSINRKEK